MSLKAFFRGGQWMNDITLNKNNSMAIAIIGPTGVGKTNLSLSIAERYSCEIVNVDSMQVYRYMDIGTAKASLLERQRIRHHLIDIVTPDDEYNLAKYIIDATNVLRDIARRGKIPLLVGGTGLYLKGLLDGLFSLPQINPSVRENLYKQIAEKGREGLYEELKQCDPDIATKIHPNDTHRLLRALEIYQATGITWSKHLNNRLNINRPLQNILKIGLSCDREELYQRINNRVEQMIQNGLLEEVRKLLNMGFTPELPAMKSIGYRHLISFICGERDWETTCNEMARDTRRYAKRQYTWFHKDHDINWFYPSQEENIVSLINNYLGGKLKEVQYNEPS